MYALRRQEYATRYALRRQEYAIESGWGEREPGWGNMMSTIVIRQPDLIDSVYRSQGVFGSQDVFDQNDYDVKMDSKQNYVNKFLVMKNKVIGEDDKNVECPIVNEVIGDNQEYVCCGTCKYNLKMDTILNFWCYSNVEICPLCRSSWTDYCKYVNG